MPFRRSSCRVLGLALWGALLTQCDAPHGPAARAETPNPRSIAVAEAGSCGSGALCVGKGGTFARLADALHDARAGSVIEVLAGTYHETADIKLSNVTIRGVGGRPHFDCEGLKIAGDKACLLLTGNDITLEKLEISGAVVSDAVGANGACIRNGPNQNFTVRDVVCHGSQDGILSSGGTILVEGSEFYDNGWTGQTHNVYFSGKCIRVTVRGSSFHDSRIGHEFKSRCQRTDISNSTFRSTKGSRDLDIPDGGDTTVSHSTLVKTAGAESEEIIGFAAESCKFPADMVLTDVRIVNSSPSARIHNFGKCAGHAIELDHATIEGDPVRDVGLVVRR